MHACVGTDCQRCLICKIVWRMAHVVVHDGVVDAHRTCATGQASSPSALACSGSSTEQHQHRRPCRRRRAAGLPAARARAAAAAPAGAGLLRRTAE